MFQSLMALPLCLSLPPAVLCHTHLAHAPHFSLPHHTRHTSERKVRNQYTRWPTPSTPHSWSDTRTPKAQAASVRRQAMGAHLLLNQRGVAVADFVVVLPSTGELSACALLLSAARSCSTLPRRTLSTASSHSSRSRRDFRYCKGEGREVFNNRKVWKTGSRKAACKKTMKTSPSVDSDAARPWRCEEQLRHDFR